MRTLLTIALFAIIIGCSQTASPPPANQNMVGESTNTPEGVYRRFAIASLSGDEAKIRLLILEHEDAHVLWQGAYPGEVAAALTELYQGMEIIRVDSPEDDRVLLQSSDSPIPLWAVKVHGTWRIDATPIIEFRKRASKMQ